MVSCYTALGDTMATRRVAQMTLARAEAALAQDRNNGRAMAHAVIGLRPLARPNVPGSGSIVPCWSTPTT